MEDRTVVENAMPQERKCIHSDFIFCKSEKLFIFCLSIPAFKVFIDHLFTIYSPFIHHLFNIYSTFIQHSLHFAEFSVYQHLTNFNDFVEIRSAKVCLVSNLGFFSPPPPRCPPSVAFLHKLYHTNIRQFYTLSHFPYPPPPLPLKSMTSFLNGRKLYAKFHVHVQVSFQSLSVKRLRRLTSSSGDTVVPASWI